VAHGSYATGTRALPDIYAQARGPQARGRVYVIGKWIVPFTYYINGTIHLEAKCTIMHL